MELQTRNDQQASQAVHSLMQSYTRLKHRLPTPVQLGSHDRFPASGCVPQTDASLPGKVLFVYQAKRCLPPLGRPLAKPDISHSGETLVSPPPLFGDLGVFPQREDSNHCLRSEDQEAASSSSFLRQREPEQGAVLGRYVFLS